MPKQKNYLDFIPIKNPNIIWAKKDNGIIILTIEYKSIYNKIAHKIFKSHTSTKIDLDEYGSFIWEKIDGKNTIFDIANDLKNEYGSDTEPLYERIVKYFQIMHSNKFISYKKKG